MFDKVGPHLPIVEEIQVALRRPVRCGLVQTMGQRGRTTICSYHTVNKIKDESPRTFTYPRKWDTWPHGGEANEDQ
jgi:hypothetical protein